MSKEEQLYADFIKKLEALLMECDAELQTEGDDKITVEFIGTRPRPNVVGFWRPIGVHLYPRCDEFIEAELLRGIAESNPEVQRPASAGPL